MADNEGFRFGALLTGPLNWRNHLKVGVFVVILIIWFCIWEKAKDIWGSNKVQPQVINSGGAPVNAAKTQSEFNLFNISDWFGGQREENHQ